MTNQFDLRAVMNVFTIHAQVMFFPDKTPKSILFSQSIQKVLLYYQREYHNIIIEPETRKVTFKPRNNLESFDCPTYI